MTALNAAISSTKKLLLLSTVLCCSGVIGAQDAAAQTRDTLRVPGQANAEQETMATPNFQEADVLQPVPRQAVNPAAEDIPSSEVLDQPALSVEAEPPGTAPLLPNNRASLNETYDEDLFYDAGDLVPTGELGRRAPRKVNPKLEPASKLIVVTKDAGRGSTQAQLVSASRAITLGRYDAALDIYEKLYENDSKNPAILMGVAVALQRMGNRDAAIAAYDELLQLDPRNVDAEVNMLGLMSEKYPQVAVRRLGELREADPSHLGIVAQLAVTYAQIGNIEEAIKNLGVAASMQPRNPLHVYNMAVIADRAGEKKQAIQYYEQALEIDSVYAGGRSLQRDVIFERLSHLR